MSVSRVLVQTRPPYPVYVGKGLLKRLPALLPDRTGARRCVLVTDPYVGRRVAPRLKRALAAAGWRTALWILPRGERAKSLDSVRRLYRFLSRERAERTTPLLAVGGGAVGDAAGFAAATWQRGIPLVHVPTTLLAQVDSAIGGKTGVDLPEAKNAIGAFHQPELVVCDVGLLKTLPELEWLSGMAEVVKYALVFDPAFARWLDRSRDSLRRGAGGRGAASGAALARMVRACAAFKARVVAADERDLSGRRELLNFGHTVGHALESASGYRLRHGEAVAWGMRAALELSRRRGWMASPAELDLAGRLLKRLKPPALPRGAGTRAVLAALRHDKKARGGRSVFVLLKRLGEPVRVSDVSDAELREVLALVRSAGRLR